MVSDVPELLPDRDDNPGVVVERIELDGVDGPTTGSAMVVVVELLVPWLWTSGTFGSLNCVG